MIGKSCEAFINELSSGSPVPGGGGASAIVGALGIALGSMVGNLTLGKKKYADVQNDIKVILEKAEKLRLELYGLVQADADVFEPLSRAYGLPKETENEKNIRNQVMEEALRKACSVPLEIMKKSLEAIDIHEELEKKGTKIAISDIGVGVLFCKSALLGASLNVFINTKLMKDLEYARGMNDLTNKFLVKGIKKADEIYFQVEKRIMT